MRSLLVAAGLLAYPGVAAAKAVVVDRCHVRLEPDAPADQQKLVARIQARLATAAVTLDATGTLVARLVFATPLATPGTTDRQAIASRFVDAHRDLLHIDKATALTFTEQAINRRGETRHLLTARFDQRYTKRTLAFLIDAAGEITSVDNDGVAPDFPMCDAPTLRPDDPKVMARIVGVQGTRFNAAGKRESFRVTKAESVTPRVVLVRRAGRPHEWFHAYTVMVDALGTSFLVDGETGELILE